MAGLSEIRTYINYRVASKSWRSFHSPYLFSLFRYILDDRIRYPQFEKIEQLRRSLLKSEEKIHVKDFGAGSKLNPSSKQLRVSDVARTALSLPYQCRVMSRLASKTSSKNIIEFGTSLGISAAYLISAEREAKVFTIEGDPQIAKVANKVFDELEIKNIELLNSTFENFFETSSLPFEKIDLVFIDGNHRHDALIEYFNKLAPYFHNDTIAVIDDIYWSADMQAGWQELINMPGVTQSVDCYQFGLLFFKHDFLQKQNHKICLPLKSIL